MSNALTISEFRKAADNLARFASTREGAQPPRDRILIQNGVDGLKFIAGTDDHTLIVVTGVMSEPQGKALVSARMLLTAAKALRGKGTLSVEFDGKGGAILVSSSGGKVRLPVVEGTIPRWVRGVPDTAVVAGYDQDFLSTLVRYVESSTGPAHVIVSTLPNNPGVLRVQYTDTYAYAVRDLPIAARSSDQFHSIKLPIDFVKACRGLDEGVFLMKNNGQVEFSDGQRIAITSGLGSPGMLPEGQRFGQDPSSYVVVERSELADALKTMGNEPEHGRATLSVDADGTLTVSQYSGDVGAYEIPGDLSGPAFKVSVTADKMYRLVKAGKSKRMSFGPVAGGIVQLLDEGEGWRVYLACVN